MKRSWFQAIVRLAKEGSTKAKNYELYLSETSNIWRSQVEVGKSLVYSSQVAGNVQVSAVAYFENKSRFLVLPSRFVMRLAMKDGTVGASASWESFVCIGLLHTLKGWNHGNCLIRPHWDPIETSSYYITSSCSAIMGNQ